MLRVAVAQLDVGDLMVEQFVFATGLGAFDTVQQHGAHRALGRVVVAVGVPLDAAIGVGDEFAARAALRDRERRDAVIVGEVIGVEVAQAELQAEPARDLLVRVAARRTGVDGHVGAFAALEQRLPLARAERARIAHFDYELGQRFGKARQLVGAPGLICGVVGKIEGGAGVGVHAAVQSPMLRSRRGRRVSSGGANRPSRVLSSAFTAAGASISMI